jgi:hypothetical protein
LITIGPEPPDLPNCGQLFGCGIKAEMQKGDAGDLSLLKNAICNKAGDCFVGERA